MRTDGSPIYAPLQDQGFDHEPHVMLGSKAPAHQPLPGVHRVAALLKGKIADFSLDALVNMLAHAGMQVKMTVKKAA